MIYYYKEKPYQIVSETKVKIEGQWQDAIIYKCLYVNPDGIIWVRLKYDFFLKFKPK